MKKIVLLLFLQICAITLQAQNVKIDKELKNLVDNVVSLRQSDQAKTKIVIANLKQNKKWTLMDELRDQNNGECFLTRKMKRFNLVPILTGILTERYGKNISRGDYLKGEDFRFNYSLIEKGIKAKKKVRYTFQGRVGQQDFVFIPCDPQSANISIKLTKGSSTLKTTGQRDRFLYRE